MTRAANSLRGETEFNLAGHVIRLRPSFENLVAVEEELGSLFALVERASEGGITISEVTGLIWHCMELDTRPSREEVGQAVLDLGLVGATKPVRAILAQVLQGQA